MQYEFTPSTYWGHDRYSAHQILHDFENYIDYETRDDNKLPLNFADMVDLLNLTVESLDVAVHRYLMHLIGPMYFRIEDVEPLGIDDQYLICINFQPD